MTIRQAADAPSKTAFPAPNGTVTVRLETTDDNGIVWQSEKDMAGEINLLASSSSLFWNMKPLAKVREPFRPPTTSLLYKISYGKKEEEIERVWASESLRRRSVSGDGFRGQVILPERATDRGVLIVPGLNRSDLGYGPLLASHGLKSMVVDLEGEPSVEAVAAAARTFKQKSKVKRLALLGISTGSVGALASLAAGDVVVNCAAMISPSACVWQDRPWYWRSQPLPAHRPRLDLEASINRLLGRPYSSRQIYRLPQHRLIEVEKITAPLALLAGRDDQFWPSAEMAEMILDRRRAFRHIDEIALFLDAGHLIAPPLVPTTVDRYHNFLLGGTVEGRARAQARAWPRLLKFFHRHLSS